MIKAPEPGFGWLYHGPILKDPDSGVPGACFRSRLKPHRLDNGRCWFGFDINVYDSYESLSTPAKTRKYPRIS